MTVTKNQIKAATETICDKKHLVFTFFTLLVVTGLSSVAILYGPAAVTSIVTGVSSGIETVSSSFHSVNDPILPTVLSSSIASTLESIITKIKEFFKTRFLNDSNYDNTRHYKVKMNRVFYIYHQNMENINYGQKDKDNFMQLPHKLAELFDHKNYRERSFRFVENMIHAGRYTMDFRSFDFHDYSWWNSTNKFTPESALLEFICLSAFFALQKACIFFSLNIEEMMLAKKTKESGDGELLLKKINGQLIALETFLRSKETLTNLGVYSATLLKRGWKDAFAVSSFNNIIQALFTETRLDDDDPYAIAKKATIFPGFSEEGGFKKDLANVKYVEELPINHLIRVCVQADMYLGENDAGEMLITDGMCEYIKRYYDSKYLPVYANIIVTKSTLMYTFTKLQAVTTNLIYDTDWLTSIGFILVQFTWPIKKLFGVDELDKTRLKQLILGFGSSVSLTVVAFWKEILQTIIRLVVWILTTLLRTSTRILDYICQKVFRAHAYERVALLTPTPSTSAIDQLREKSSQKSKKINDLNDQVNDLKRTISDLQAGGARQGRLKSVNCQRHRDVAEANLKIMKTLRDGFAQYDASRLRVMVGIVCNKKQEQVANLSKKALVNELLKVPVPTASTLKRRLRRAGYATKGKSKDQLLAFAKTKGYA